MLAVTGALSAVAAAHVRLDTLNGGETLRIGETVTVRWTELESHSTIGWNVYYSVTGPRGPWLPVAIGLPVAARRVQWNVPAPAVGPSARVRIRVVQDNLRFSFEAVSEANLAIEASLTADRGAVSRATGGTQALTIDAGPRHAGARYWLLGSASGTAPGAQFGPFAVPLNPDRYLLDTAFAPSVGPLRMPFGILDAQGRAVVTLRWPPGLPAPFVGLRLHHAALVAAPTGPALRVVTNPVALTIDA